MGRLKGTVEVPAGCDEATAWDAVEKSGLLASSLEGRQIVKKIYVPNRIFNVVAK